MPCHHGMARPLVVGDEGCLRVTKDIALAAG
jgi:hypothetical protein